MIFRPITISGMMHDMTVFGVCDRILLWNKQSTQENGEKMKKVLLTFILTAFAVISTHSASAAMNPYVRLGIITFGSALACSVAGDALTQDEANKSTNATKAALFCGGIAAAMAASSDSSFAINDSEGAVPQIFPVAEENALPPVSLVLRPNGAEIVFQSRF